MTDQLSIFDQPPQKGSPGSNMPEFTVSEIAGGIKKTLEDAFGRVRVRGEISQPKFHTSGHLYFDLKDENALIASVCWKGNVNRLPIRPEHGMEVVATGRVTTYGKTSKYQLVVEEMALAGQGALLALLEARKAKLAAEGLFDASRKKKLPALPRRIGIITSETGAVIQDIIHRLSDRFPVEVLLWPVAVQGPNAAAQIAAAIDGMNRMDGIDLLIVARGGGSLEDLMAFNEEIVVRAAANSRLPLISAVGHETDTTLIDFASDLRAPTPTAAAEIAVPVRRELLAQVNETARRLQQLLAAQGERASLKLQAATGALGDPRRLLETAMQRLDDNSERLSASLKQNLLRATHRVENLRVPSVSHYLANAARQLQATGVQLPRALAALTEKRADRLERVGALLESHSYQKVLDRGFALVRGQDGEPLTKATALKKNADISITFGDGKRQATVTD